MKRHFGIPIAIAAALHLGLLFGFRSPGPAVHNHPVQPPVPRADPETVFVVYDPPPEAEDAGAGGGSAADVPRGDETLRPPKPDDQVMRVDPAREHPKVSPTAIPPGAFGPGAGNGPTFGMATGPISVTSLDRVPRALAQPGAVYPYDARKDGLNGEVLVAFTVNTRGEVQNPQVVRSTSSVFEEAALRAVGKWRFEPGRQHGRVVTFRMAVPIVFRLDDASGS